MARPAGEASASAQAISPGAARHDVVVIGAGLAGLYAARELRKRFVDVLLVEASAQVGGRIQQACVLPCNALFESAFHFAYHNYWLPAGGQLDALACGAGPRVCARRGVLSEGRRAPLYSSCWLQGTQAFLSHL